MLLLTTPPLSPPSRAATPRSPHRGRQVRSLRSDEKCKTRDPSCAYHMWVVWSSDGGSTWDGGGGAFPGTAGAAYEVDPSGSPQTDVFPAIAAGDPGKVDVAWLRTNEIEPTDPAGKFDPGGCAGPGPANGNPTFYPPTCSWNLYAS